MTVYLVDFENVRSAGLKGVENLGYDDKVVIFYSKNADAITFDVHMLLSRSKAELETFMILRGGRNSLDFQLSTYLGYLVMENKYENIVIVSQDKGFLCATSFWDENRELCNAEIVMSKSIEAFEMKEVKDFIENDSDDKFIEKVAVTSSRKNKDIASNSEVNPSHNKIPKEESDATRVAAQREKSKETQNAVKKEEPKETQNAVQKEELKETQNAAQKEELKETQNAVQKEEPKETQNAVKKEELKETQSAGKKEESKKKQNTDNKKESDKTKSVDKKAESKESQSTVQKNQSKAHKSGHVQNPMSKNKIFAAEVKLNITEDVQKIVMDKYGMEYVPTLVELIGKSTEKQQLYTMLVHKFGQELGREMYVMIKGQYANLKRK